MRKPPELKKWLDDKEIQDWANETTVLKDYKRRLAIVLTQVHRLYADDIADVLGVSVSTIWSWISKYWSSPRILNN
jgi:DNA-directed RNA polymerase specialized sigma24 family protein